MEKYEDESRINTLSPERVESSSFEFNEGENKGEWIALSNPENNGLVEIEYFKSKESKEIILFVPGMPGDGVSWMKERYLDPLLEHGSDLMLMRHSGLLVDNENTDNYVANKERKNRGGIVGKEKATIDDWVKEMGVVMDYLSKQDKPVKIISHSFGGFITEYTMAKNGENRTGHVQRWVNLSGATFPGKLFESEEFRQQLEAYVVGVVSKLYDFDESTPLIEQFQALYQELSDELRENGLVIDADVISVYPEKDNLVNIQAGEDLHKNLGKGLLVDDRTVHDGSDLDKELETNPFIIHDFPHLTTETLLRLLKVKTSSNLHKVQFKNN